MRMRAPVLVGVVVALVAAAPAHAAKTYNDPWLESDLQQMRAPAALDILARTPKHVIVGDIGTGARLTDPDLASHLVKLTGPYTCVDAYGPGPAYAADPANGDVGCDFLGSGTEAGPTTSPDGDPTDPNGPGTSSAEIIAGLANNGVEGAGVAPNARVLPVRACYGTNPDCFSEVTVDALTYAVAMGATIIDAPWPPDTPDSTAFRQFVHAKSNVLFAFAISGTGQNAAPYPICQDKTTYPNVICVGPANANDTPGTTDGDTTTDVSAPGAGGVPTAAGARTEARAATAAVAHVSGAAALLRGLAPDLTASAIRQVLVSTSRQVAGYTTANKAHGIIDLEAAVRSVQQTAGLVTPASGHGAAADSPDPFPGQSTPVPTPTPTPTPSPAPQPTPVV
ncbi:MAG: S8 family serine peptidase, partial [Solirubrobacteraceae bacterium]